MALSARTHDAAPFRVVKTLAPTVGSFAAFESASLSMYLRVSHMRTTSDTPSYLQVCDGHGENRITYRFVVERGSPIAVLHYMPAGEEKCWAQERHPVHLGILDARELSPIWALVEALKAVGDVVVTHGVRDPAIVRTTALNAAIGENEEDKEGESVGPEDGKE